MADNCYIILLSSGIDSTAAFLNLINENDLKNDILIPIYVWWREYFLKVMKKEFSNCEKIIDYIKEKYKEKGLNIYKVKKIKVPLIFYEEIRDVYNTLDQTDYFCYFRNIIFIISALSYIFNYFRVKRIDNYKKIVIVAGFIGYEADENLTFTNDMKILLNNYINDSSKAELDLRIDFYTPYLLDESSRTFSRQILDLKKYNDLDILKYTWSCWRNSDVPCNDCNGCNSRKRKFYRSEIEDPLNSA